MHVFPPLCHSCITKFYLIVLLYLYRYIFIFRCKAWRLNHYKIHSVTRTLTSPMTTYFLLRCKMHSYGFHLLSLKTKMYFSWKFYRIANNAFLIYGKKTFFKMLAHIWSTRLKWRHVLKEMFLPKIVS